MPALTPLLTIMIRAAEKASKSLLRDFGEVENLQVSLKGPGDFVSAADRRAEQIIHQELMKARPDYGFVMEESGNHGPKEAEYRFIIDPLDGTTNFLHGIPHWSISIGLEKGGDAIAGVVYDPVKNEMFYAEKGAGAFMNDRRIRVSGRRDLDHAAIAYFHMLRARGDEDQYVRAHAALRAKTGGLRNLGSAALDMAYVAAGRFDGFYQQSVHAWDIAAGVVIVREAGGKVQGLTRPEDPIFDGGILASNLNLFAPLQALVKEA